VVGTLNTKQEAERAQVLRDLHKEFDQLRQEHPELLDPNSPEVREAMADIAHESAERARRIRLGSLARAHDFVLG
jgi:hypothetical protein